MKIDELKEQAARCRRLAEQADPTTRQRLLNLAEEYDARIKAAEPTLSPASRNLGTDD